MLIQRQDPVFSDPDLLLLVDSKGLYDAKKSELATDDAARALEVPVIKEGLQLSRCRIRWIPHNRNPWDPMTKFKGAHAKPLWSLLRRGTYAKAPSLRARKSCGPQG